MEKYNIHVFQGRKSPFICVSDVYCGVWLEHVGDAVTYAELYPEKGLSIAVDTVDAFISYQKDGQFPCYIWDEAISKRKGNKNIGYAQVQECLSFGSLCRRVYALRADKAFAERCYASLSAWVGWTEKYRMTTGKGLVEMFVGFDTGHDNSSRLDGLRFPENRRTLFRELSAAQKPSPFDKVAPVLAVDMSANLFGNYKALAFFAQELGRENEAETWQNKANDVKKNLYRYCYDEDGFFYDVDKTGRKRKYRTCAVFALLQEKVLTYEEDKEVLDRLFTQYVFNEKEFWSKYPFPAVALSQSLLRKHKKYNDWGYFTQGNTVLRTRFWMDDYGFTKEQDTVSRKWVEAWTKCFDTMPVGQELDPVTGVPSSSSPWYSTGMLFYLWSAKRLRIE